MVGCVVVGLFLSGVTVWPAEWELKTFVRLVWGDGPPVGALHAWLVRIIGALADANSSHPFLLYAYDWLAFAHIVLAILFAGAIRDLVRNVWVVQCGLIMCALIPVLAAVCIPLRGVPGFWFLVDAAFAPAAGIPLWIALRDIQRVERGAASRQAPAA